MRELAVAALLICAVAFSSCTAGSGVAGVAEEGEVNTAAGGAANTSAESAAPYEEVGFAMGTVVNQTIYMRGENLSPAAITAEIIGILENVESKWLSWRVEDSDIAAINESAGTGVPARVADETAAYIEDALRIAEDSGGAFDPTIGKLSRLWDFDGGKNKIPDSAEIKRLAKDVGYAGIRLDGRSVLLEKASGIDLGAAGKGIGCDEIEAYLNEADGVKGALVNVGGSSILTYGEKGTGEPWKVAVLDPRDPSGFLGAISLDGTHHVSTSGDYERYFEIDGKRYHHILDPKTGYPADSGLMSVTVVAKDGADCDALSTACFVLGYEKALPLLAKYGAEGIFVDTDRRVFLTEGIRDRFTLIADGYDLEREEGTK
jgi:thiamine biosynthesis lipoprotein